MSYRQNNWNFVAYYLHLCYRFLHPQVLFQRRIMHTAEVIAVHNDMDETVHKPKEPCMTAWKVISSKCQIAWLESIHTTHTWCEANTDVRCGENGHMMIHMQEGDLIMFLAQHKEHGIEQIQHLQCHVAIWELGCHNRIVCESEVQRLAEPIQWSCAIGVGGIDGLKGHIQSCMVRLDSYAPVIANRLEGIRCHLNVLMIIRNYRAHLHFHLQF